MHSSLLQGSRAISVALGLWVQLSLAMAAAAAPPPTLEADVARLLSAFDVPGLAVAIVKDGEVVTASGFGVRKLGSSEPVDAETLFGIASNTKAFTAVALAMLVDEGKLKWDDPVVRHLPGFQMADPWVTREITVRDLLIHNSGLGLGAGDLMWVPPTNFSTDEIVARIRHLKPVSSFRSRYAYDNVMYVVAGQVVAAIAGKPWEAFVTERILGRAGLKSTGADASHLSAAKNAAAPHAMNEASILESIKPASTSNVLAAAGLNSNAVDMARWMTVLLDGGRLGADDNSPRLYSARQAREMWSLWTPIRIGEPPTPLAALKPEFLGCGLGFILSDYRGRKLISHNGTLTGYSSRVVLVPALKLGVAVMTNQWHSDGARRALMMRILDHYLGVTATDWIKIYGDVDAAQATKARAVIAAEAGRRAQGSDPVRTPRTFAGAYEDRWMGQATITEEDGRWLMRFKRSPGLVGELVHWQGDTYISRWQDRTLKADAHVTFMRNPDGSVAEFRMKAVSSETDFSFDFHDLSFTPMKVTM